MITTLLLFLRNYFSLRGSRAEYNLAVYAGLLPSLENKTKVSFTTSWWLAKNFPGVNPSIYHRLMAVDEAIYELSGIYHEETDRLIDILPLFPGVVSAYQAEHKRKEYLENQIANDTIWFSGIKPTEIHRSLVLIMLHLKIADPSWSKGMFNEAKRLDSVTEVNFPAPTKEARDFFELKFGPELEKMKSEGIQL